jgi:hypothetical protein
VTGKSECSLCIVGYYTAKIDIGGDVLIGASTCYNCTQGRLLVTLLLVLLLGGIVSDVWYCLPGKHGRHSIRRVAAA